MHVPLLDLQIERPTRSSLAWYGGIGTMAAAGLVEWPLAAIIVAGHVITENSKSSTVVGAVEGAEAGAG